jgi:hypothetical protein
VDDLGVARTDLHTMAASRIDTLARFTDRSRFRTLT